MEFDIAAELEGMHLDRMGYSQFPSRLELMFYHDIRDGLGLRRILQIDSVIHAAFSRDYNADDSDPHWKTFVDIVIRAEMAYTTKGELFEKGLHCFLAKGEEGEKRFHLRLHLSQAILDVVTLSRSDIRWLA